MSLSRRSFVGAAGAAALSAVAVTGYAAAEEATSEQVELGEPVETLTADFVVCGAGGCGLAATARAAQLGLDVICVEQSPFTGGTSLCTEGLFAVESSLQKECGIELTVQECFEASMDYNHWEGDGMLAKEFFATSAANYEWLAGELGVQFKYATVNGSSLPTWHVYEEEEGTSTPGSLYLGTVAQAATDFGARFQLSTTAKELIMEDGKVAGVLCQGPEGTIRIEAPTVLLSCGGFADNKEMLADLAGIDPDRVVPTGVGARNGEGIQMGLAAGAVLNAHPETIMFYGGVVEGAPSMSPFFAATGACPVFWFNNKGVRFTNEELSVSNFSYSGNAMRNQKAVYCLINDEMIDHMMNVGIYNAVGEYIHKGETVPTLRDDIELQLEENAQYCFKGETIEEVAEFVGCDAEVLANELETYNGYCAEGVDEQFNKPAEFLIPVEGGPYYCFYLKQAFFTTVGGLKVSTDNEVLDENEDPIPGLYAGGSDAGGLYGATYDVSVCTASQQGWAVHSGKRSAEQAAAYLGR